MKSSDLTSMGVKNLWRRKTRTLLTILGVIIGTAAIVTMVSLGLGMNKAFMKEMERMGNIRVITVSKYGGYWEEDDKKDKKDMPLDDEAVKFFDELEGVDVALPILRSGMEITAGRLQSYGSIIGVDFDKLAKFKYEIGEGRVPEAADKNGILVGASIPKQFYNPRSRRGGWGENEVDVMNERLLGYINGMYDSNGNKKKGIRLTPTGLLTEAYDERDWSIYMDVTVLKKILSDEERKNRGQRNTWENKRRKQEKEYEEIKILCKDLNDVEKVQEAVKARGYNAWSSFDFVKSQRKQIEIIQMVLGGIGAVSLLIAAIGITNTMIMAIYERTRERI